MQNQISLFFKNFIQNEEDKKNELIDRIFDSISQNGQFIENILQIDPQMKLEQWQIENIFEQWHIELDDEALEFLKM